MKAHAKHRFLCLLLSVLMIVSLLPTAALAAETETSTWEKVDFDKITADDVVAITMTNGTGTFALPTAGKGGNGQPLAVSATVDGDKLSIDGAKDDFGWKITANSDSTFAIKNAAGESLYVTATNNGVRIGNPQSGKEVTAQFSLKDGYLTASDGTATLYLGVYNNQDWRCYAPKSDGTLSNIGGQTVGFWKFSEGTTPVEPTEEPDPSEEPAVEPTLLAKLDAAPADGDVVYLMHPESSSVLTGAASGKKLAGVTAEKDGDDVILSETMAALTVSVTDGVYVFALDGKYLTSAETGNGLSFAEDAESDLAKWTLEQQSDGT